MLLGVLLSIAASRLWRCPGDPVTAVLYDPGTPTMLIARGSGAELWTAEAERPVRVYEFGTLPGLAAHLALSPDGSTILTGSVDATALWDTQTGRLVHVLQSQQSMVTSLAFSSDGRTAITGSTDSSAALWDVRTGDLMHRLQGH